MANYYECQKCFKPCDVVRDVYPSSGMFIPAKAYTWSRCCEAPVNVKPVKNKETVRE